MPLAVSPFINLPTANTLPYTYKAMPSALPPSVLSGPPGGSSNAVGGADAPGASSSAAAAPDQGRPRFVVSSSGHAAHPDDIIASCRALQAHVARLQADAEADLRALDERIAARELAEKRRVAPGWLDSDARLLEPERAPGAAEQPAPAPWGSQPGAAAAAVSEMAAPDPGAELDRAFGSLGLGR